MPKESKARQVEHQERVGDLFWLRAFFVRNLFLQAKWLTSITARRFCSVWGSKYAKKSATMVEPGLVHLTWRASAEFLATENMVVVSYHPCLIWPLVIYFCFWEWNHSRKGVISRTSQKFWNSCWPSYMQFQNVSFNGASSSGRNVLPVA
jgi:hypothetical protein